MAVETSNKLSGITIGLHWVVAIFMIGLIALGLYMEDSEVLLLYILHKSFGVIALVFILVRVIWRLTKGWPEPASAYKAWEQKLSKIVHWLLLIGMVLFPVSGMVMSGAAGYGIPLFGLELMEMNFDPNDPQKIIPHSAAVAKLAGSIHGLLGNVFIALISLHVIGALKHHFMDKDKTLLRMLGK